MNKIFLKPQLPAIMCILITWFGYAASELISWGNDVQKATIKSHFLASKTINDSLVEDNYEFQLTNSYSNKALHHLQMECDPPIARSSGKMTTRSYVIRGADLVAIAPAAMPDSQPVILANGVKAIVNIRIMEPGNSYLLHVAVFHREGENEFPFVRLVHCDEDITVANYGLEDWIHENHFRLIVAELLIAFCSIVIYFYQLSKEKSYLEE